MTCAFGGQYSIQLSYRRVLLGDFALRETTGEYIPCDGWIASRSLRRAVLYPAELQAHTGSRSINEPCTQPHFLAVPDSFARLRRSRHQRNRPYDRRTFS